MIKLAGTEKTPNVLFDTVKGVLEIEGKSFPEDPRDFYAPIINSIKNEDIKKLAIKLQFEYMNTSSTKMMLEMLRAVKRIDDLIVTWVSEEGDEEMVETGEYFSELSEIPFNYLTIDEY